MTQQTLLPGYKKHTEKQIENAKKVLVMLRERYVKLSHAQDTEGMKRTVSAANTLKVRYNLT